MSITNQDTLNFMSNLKNNSDFRFENQLEEKREFRNYDKDTIVAALNFDNSKSPATAISDLHIAFIISKLNCVNISELNYACKIRMSKLQNVKLPTEDELSAVLKRLIKAGIICQQVITGPQVFYCVTNNGRNYLNRAMINKNVRDLDFYEVKRPSVLLGEAAVTYAVLALAKEGYKIKQKRIVKVNREVSRFPAILSKGYEQVVLECLYLKRDASITTEEEFADEVKQKIKKICHYLIESENDRAVLLCNDMSDIQILLSFLSEPKLAKLFSEVSERIFFTSASNIKNAQVVSEGLARFELVFNDDGGLRAGDNCIFDFRL